MKEQDLLNNKKNNLFHLLYKIIIVKDQKEILILTLLKTINRTLFMIIETIFKIKDISHKDYRKTINFNKLNKIQISLSHMFKISNLTIFHNQFLIM